MLGVFYCSEKGQAITCLRDSAGRLPGKPEQNAVPMKGDTMAIAWAGNGFPPPADKHHILSVHTAVPSKGAAGFFIRHISIYSPNRIQKNTWFLLWAYLPLCGCAFFVL